jgi:hypothetical protein
MSRKLEIRTRMAELQKEFSGLNDELKDMEREEKAVAAREKYKDYAFKVGTYGYKVEPAEKIEDANDEDREGAGAGRSGLVYTGFEGNREFGYIMMKDKADYSRIVRICQIIDAVEHLADEKVKDKEPHIKVILGEETK